MKDRVYAFGYYGGKLSHLKYLLPLLPKCQTFVEAFGGSGAVLLNREPSPVEVYNDLDGDVVTFFRVLRERPEELINAIQLTPYSRAEFASSCERQAVPDLERARRFYVRVGQSRYGMPDASPGQWSYCVADARRDMSSAVSAWRSCVERLEVVANRLLTAQIENVPALNLLERYDAEGTLFYLDPPYVKSTRNSHEDIYVHEMTDAEHLELAKAANACKGSVAVSGYESDLYDAAYAGWHKTYLKARTSSSSNTNGKRTIRQEVLWTNYDPAAIDDLPLFAEALP